MKIELSADVKQYLHRKHKDVLEVYARRNYSERLDDNAPLELEIHFGTPEARLMDQFASYDVEGFKLYIEKDIIDENKDVLIHLGRVLGMKHIEIEGLEVH